MKYILCLVFTVCFVGELCAQQGHAVSNGNQPVSSKRSEFQTEVRQELVSYPHGAMLYRRCDVFARMINHRAAVKLGIVSQNMMSEDADTSYMQDVSNSMQDQDETTVAISRKDPKVIVVGANDGSMSDLSMPAYVSTNSGHTWLTYRLPMPSTDPVTLIPSGDPIIISDDSGDFYYSFLLEGYNSMDASSISDLMVARSSDAIHWKLGNSVLGLNGPSTSFEDKEVIGFDRDPNSPHHGRLYIAWNEFDTSGIVQHMLAYSDDQTQTWSSPVVYSKTYGYFPLVHVGKNGTLFIASSTEDDTDVESVNSHGMTISNDGGETFSEVPIAHYTLFPLIPSGYPGLKGDNGFRAFPYVAFDIDPSDNAIDAVFGSYDNKNADAALFATRSTNAGNSWSSPLQIGTPAAINTDHYMPWVSHDALTGETNVSLYSSEEDPTWNENSRAVQCTFSSTNHMQNIGSRLFNPLADTINGGDFIGDYAGNDAYNGSFAAAWTENRPPNHDDGEIFAFVSSPLSSVSGSTSQINAEVFNVADPSPNPAAGGHITFIITSNTQLPASIQVFDLRGNEVLATQSLLDPSVQTTVTLDVHTLSAGVYHAQISCGSQSVQKNFVVLR
jgi:hypothetical protein